MLTWDSAELERGAVGDLVLTFLGTITLHDGGLARAADGATLLLASCRVPQARVDGHARWLKRARLFGARREDAPTE